MGAGAATVSCICLVWGSGTRIPLMHGGRGRLWGEVVDLDWDKFPDPARLDLAVIHYLDLV